MAQISIEELYRGEGNGEKYGILGQAIKDNIVNGHPMEYNDRTCFIRLHIITSMRSIAP